MTITPQKSGCKPGEIRMGEACIPKYCQNAKKIFGETYDCKNAGFIMPDGSMIKFRDEDIGWIEHIQIHQALENFDFFPDGLHGGEKSPSIQFMNMCNSIRTRIMYDENEPNEIDSRDEHGRAQVYFSTIKKPTISQVKTIQNILKSLNASVYFDKKDVSDDGYEPTCSYKNDSGHYMSPNRFIWRCWP